MTPNTVVADSTIWIDFLAARSTPQVQWMRRHQATWNIRTTDLSVCEVLQGTKTDADFSRAQQLLQFFGVIPTGGVTLAIESAANYRQLRSKGITVRKTIDCIIATACIQRGVYLIHNDRDFDPFERWLGLKVIHSEQVEL